MALAVLTIFSCSKEENPGNEVLSGDKANVTISLKGKDAPGTKATTGGAPHTGDTKINNYIAFFFTDGGALVSKHYVADPTADNANKLETTTAAKKICVIANTGALTSGIFKDVTNETQLKAVTGSLSAGSSAPHTASSQTGTNVWMEGTSTVTYSGANTGEATVTMSFLAAKIEVIVNDNRTNNTDPTKIQITLTDIVLLNAGADAKFFASEADKMIQTSYFSGDVSYSGATATEATFLSETYAASGVYFYAFGNSDETKPTVLAIKASRVEGSGTATTVYYPIAFSNADAGATVAKYADFVPGNFYTVTLTLKGDVAGGEGGGTTEPDKPLVSADVTVTVTPASWTPQTVGKEFN